MDKPVYLENIKMLHQIGGEEGPRHPLFAISRIEDLPQLPEDFPQKLVYGFYGISIKRNLNSYVRYGRKNYDFDAGVMGFTAPKQLIEFDRDINNGANGWMLVFQPELLAIRSLRKHIKKMNFFHYEVNEALHLSQEEEGIIEGIFSNIHREYTNPVDRFGLQVVLSNLELLLSYSQRFYQRQFIIREQVEASLVARFEAKLESSLSTGQGLPTVAQMAEQMCLSPTYLSDSLKSLTGKNTQEHIHLKLIEKAKEMLLGSSNSISEIAYELGFEYPQYFSRLFKKKIGMTPRVYRQLRH